MYHGTTFNASRPLADPPFPLQVRQ